MEGETEGEGAMMEIPNNNKPEFMMDFKKFSQSKGLIYSEERVFIEGEKQACILKAEGQAKGFDLINKSFTGNAQTLRKLEVTENSLMNNSKIIITKDGISPQLIIGDLPLGNKK
jgi:hypothetical protein